MMKRHPGRRKIGFGVQGASKVNELSGNGSEMDEQSLPEGGRSIPIRLQPHSDVEVRVATGIIINFSGDEFIASLFQALPPAFRNEDEAPTEVDGKILFRAAFSPRRWIDFIETAADQLGRLREQGLIPARNPEGRD
jgi:hypothetical protein